jgi:hypothetical protein
MEMDLEHFLVIDCFVIRFDKILAAWKEAPPTTSEEAASLVARALKVGREALAVSCFSTLALASCDLFILLPLHTKEKKKNQNQVHSLKMCFPYFFVMWFSFLLTVFLNHFICFFLLLQGFLEYYSLPFPQLFELQSGTGSSSWPEEVHFESQSLTQKKKKELQSSISDSSSWPKGVQLKLYTLPVSHFIYYLSITTFCVRYKYQLYLHLAFSTFFVLYLELIVYFLNIPSKSFTTTVQYMSIVFLFCNKL